MNSETELKYTKLDLKKESNYFLYVVTIFTAIGGFLFGYDTGVISGALLFVGPEFNLTDVGKELVVSVALGGAIIGSIIGGYIGDKFGRRFAVIVASSLFIVGSVVLGASYSFEMLLVGRVIVGSGIGVASNIVPVFVAEISPPEKRGALVTLNNLFITGGQLISYLVDSAFAHVDNGWRYMLGIAAVPALIQFLGMVLLVEESPRWLLSQNRKDDAIRIIQRIRGTPDVDDEVKEIEDSIQLDTSTGWSSLLEPRVRPALFIGMGLQIIQQFLGINTAMYYSATIIKMSGVNDNKMAIWFSDLVAATNAVFTIISIILIDRIGRRVLLLSTMIPTVLFLGCLGFSFYAKSINLFSSSIVGLLALDSLVLYVAFFAIGLGPIPWTVNSEIYPLKIRSKANSVATMMNWVANLIISMSFLSYIHIVTEAGAFWTYTGIGFFSWFFVYFKLPETMGKSMEQIERELNKEDESSINIINK